MATNEGTLDRVLRVIVSQFSRWPSSARKRRGPILAWYPCWPVWSDSAPPTRYSGSEPANWPT